MAAHEVAPPAGDGLANRQRAWLVFAAVYFASAVAPFNQYKVPPLIPILVPELDLSLVQAGLLMSVFSLAGMVTSLPAGLLFRRFGPRLTGTFSVGCTALGALLGSIAPTADWLLACRLLEGIGMGMTAVVALVVIAAWFPPHERGMPTGIFTTWIPVGNAGMLLLAPWVEQALGWRAVWLCGGLAALASLALYVALVEMPPATVAQPAARVSAWHHGLLNPSAWLLSLAFACFQGARVGFLTWAPTYLTQGGLALAGASLLTSTNLLITIPAALLVGWVLDRIGSRRRVYSLAFLLLIPGWGSIFQVDPAWIILPMLFTGALTAMIPTAVNAAAPETAREPREVGPAVGIVAIGRNGGQVLGPALLALVLQAGGGWGSVSLALVALTVIGLAAGWLVRVK